MTETVQILRGGRIVDPANGLDVVGDVGIKGGKIAWVGDTHQTKDADVIDVSGCVVTAGLVDVHIHAYGIIGFAYPDRCGVYQGVTSFVDAGSAGVTTFHEMSALLEDSLITDLYAGVMLRPLGLVGVDYEEGDIRSIPNLPMDGWLDLAENHSDKFKYVKTGAIYSYGPGVIKLGKGLAEILGVPLYLHTGELDGPKPGAVTADAYSISEKGDMITHCYHGNPGGILDENGKLLPEVKDAARRGVLLDVGFGSFNFSFDVAERALAQDLPPALISSDLQQINVTGPCYSLTNVMSIFLMLGLNLSEVIERATIAPARAIAIDHKAGSLTPGFPADISVLRVEEGEFEYADVMGGSRQGNLKILPVMTFKNGQRYDADLDLAHDQRNWHWHIAEEKIPTVAETLGPAQREFLGALAAQLETLDWKGNCVDIPAANKLNDCFYRTKEQVGISLQDSLRAVHNIFFEDPFTYQLGLLLMRTPKQFAIERMRSVAA